MMAYKKVSTQRCEKEVCQINKGLHSASDTFQVVAPVNTTCMARYIMELEKAMKSDSIIGLKNSFHQAGAFYPDFHNNYRRYEVTKTKEDDGNIRLTYQPL